MITTGEAGPETVPRALHLSVYPRDGSRRRNAPAVSIVPRIVKYSFERFRPETRLNPRRNYVIPRWPFQRNDGLGDDREFFENMPTIKFFPGMQGRGGKFAFSADIRTLAHLCTGLNTVEKKKGRTIRRLLTVGLSRRALKFREIE